MVLELHPVGAVVEARLLGRGSERIWWCGSGDLSSRLHLEAVAADGSVAPSAPDCDPAAGAETMDSGWSWSLERGQAISLGALRIACPDSSGSFRVTGPSGQCVDVPPDGRLRAVFDGTLDGEELERCRTRAEARWYGASEYRREEPWRPPGAPLSRVFPVSADDVRGLEGLGRLVSNELEVTTLTWEAVR